MKIMKMKVKVIGLVVGVGIKVFNILEVACVAAVEGSLW